MENTACPVQKASIYGLCDPLTMEVRYVGQSCNPERRLHEHIADATVYVEKRQWIQGLVKQGLKPTLTVMEEVPTDQADTAEQTWINRFGPVLLNRAGNYHADERDVVRPVTHVRTLAEVERDYILAITGKIKNVVHAARLLGIGRQTLYNKLKTYSPKAYPDGPGL